METSDRMKEGKDGGTAKKGRKVKDKIKCGWWLG